MFFVITEFIILQGKMGTVLASVPSPDDLIVLRKKTTTNISNSLPYNKLSFMTNVRPRTAFPKRTAFPNGILIIARLFLLFTIPAILLRYYDFKQQGIPSDHLYRTATDVLEIICALLLLSRKEGAIKWALGIIATLIMVRIGLAITSYYPINTPAAAGFFIFFLILYTFFFIFIRMKSKQYFG